MEGCLNRGVRRRSLVAVATVLATLLAMAGCGGGGDETTPHSTGIELASRLPSDDALNIAIADVAAIRKSLGMKPGSIPPTDDDDSDLIFLDEIAPSLGILQSGAFPQPIVSEAMRRANWIAGVAGDRGATAFSISGDSADFESLLADAGMEENDGEYVTEDGGSAIALGEGLIVFADDPGDAKPVVDEENGDVPEELVQLDGDGELITLARFGADCIDAVATTDAPGEDGQIAFFTTATPDPDKITAEGVSTEAGRVEGDSARISIPAAKEPAGEPPALIALQNFSVDYDCDA